jgi:hypothetical protein
MSHSRPLRLVLLLAALAAPAALAAQDTMPLPKAAKIKRNPEVISLEEIQASGDVQNAYDLVQRLRPTWLTFRGPSSINLATPELVVYFNGVRRGGPDSLRELELRGVKELRHLRGTDATQRFGTGHENGAILVTSM